MFDVYLRVGCPGNCLDTQESAFQRYLWCSNGRPRIATSCSEFESASME